MNKILSHSEKYIFGEFTLTSDALLYYKNSTVKVPPKEFSILLLLLNSAGVLISKDDFLEKVWPKETVGEESLTRCIYVLRRLLHEGKNNHYIDTVYGKGYRFIQPVSQVKRVAESESKCTLAVLPFQLPEHSDALMIHDFLVQSLSKYAYLGLNVLSSTLMSNCKTYDDIVCFLEKMKPSYYLSAQTIKDNESASLRIELIRTHDHSIVDREKFDLCDNIHLTCLNLQGVIDAFLARHIPCLNKGKIAVPVMKEFDTAFTYFNAHHRLYSYTPSNVKKALSQFLACLEKDPNHSTLLTGIAECYFAMAQLGLMSQKYALSEAKTLVMKALSQEPNNALALALMALLSSINKEQCVADIIFKQATLLGGQNGAIYYYYAWHLLLSGRIKEAFDAVDISLKCFPTLVAANILKVLLKYIDGNPLHGIMIAKQELDSQIDPQPVLQSFLSVMLAKTGQYDEASELAENMKNLDENNGIIDTNYKYVQKIKDDSINFNKNNDDDFIYHYFMQDLCSSSKEISQNLNDKDLHFKPHHSFFYHSELQPNL